jgi:hypothetical protein
MQLRKAVISTTVGLGMGAIALTGAGAASADTAPDGRAGQGGNEVSVTSTVNRTSILSRNNLVSGNRVSVLNGTHITLSVNILNGPILSNNVLNSGANSFNSSVTQIRANNSFNTVTVTKNTVTTNNTLNTGKDGHAGQPGGGWEH